MSTQDKCIVCVEHAICSKIILDAPDGTPRLRGSSGSYFGSVLEIVFISAQDRYTVCAKCNIGLEIFLGAPNSSPS
jgi:hypothetical protein